MPAIPPNLIRNEPCEEGRQLGAVLARWADDAMPTYAADFARDGLPVPQRCRTCAFRAGTHPNGCVPTTMDALKSVMELTDFRCHDRDAMTPEGPQVCVGWAMLVTDAVKRDAGAVKTPWPFSDEMNESKL